jgi:LPS O-antigen subunit length determinant protein (WzzB/FepE family)
VKKEETKKRFLTKGEIDLLVLAKTLWRKRTFILKSILVFISIGIIIGFLSPNQYTAGSIFVPQSSSTSSRLGNLGGLASVAGIDLGGVTSGTEATPSLYPKIVSSTKFRRKLLNSKITIEETGESISYSEYYDSIFKPGAFYYLKQYTIGLPVTIMRLAKGQELDDVQNDNFYSGPIRISKIETKHFKRLQDQINIQHNPKEGFVELFFTMPEPLMAAEMAESAQKLLQDEVIAYKIQNAREQLKFIEDRFEEKRVEFEGIQNSLADFKDKNLNVTSARVNSQLQRLESEYGFALNIYSELAKQLEQARLQVTKDTPVFSVIEPVTVPNQKSSPNRPLIVIAFVFLGLIYSISHIFVSQILLLFKEKWQS